VIHAKNQFRSIIGFESLNDAGKARGLGWQTATTRADCPTFSESAITED